MLRKPLLVVALTTAAVASLAAVAQRYVADDALDARGRSADLPPTQRQQQLAQRASDFAPIARTKATLRPTPIAAAAAPTTDDVYDVDSFGRSVKYLGLTSAFITLDPACPPPSSPDEYCQTLNPTPGAFTNFNFPDAARIVLPAKASNSILCYWFSPLLTVTYQNPTAGQVIARFRYNPTLTIENSVLDDPALIDPTTGAPFGGKLLTSMSSSEIHQVPMAPGVAFTERLRDSTVCMAGFVSKRALVDNYGLTDAQAKEFFKRPTTIRMNISGQTQYVANASLVYGLRVMGD